MSKAHSDNIVVNPTLANMTSEFKGKEMELRLTGDGTAECDWWTPEIGDISCELCGKCPGWRSSDRDSECIYSNPWCG